MRIRKTSKYIEGGAGLPSYFTTEIDTGMKWIDGKPIYRKVVNGTKTNGETLVSNVSALINAYGIITSGSNKRQLPYFEIYNNQNYEANIYQNGSNIKIIINFAGTTSSEIIVTLEYTKTTD